MSACLSDHTGVCALSFAFKQLHLRKYLRYSYVWPVSIVLRYVRRKRIDVYRYRT